MKTKSQAIMRKLAFLLVLMISLSAKAQVKLLMVNLSDGSTASFALADNPVVKTSDGQFTVETANAELSVAFSELISYSFSTVETSEETLVVPSHRINSNHIIFNNLKGSEDIRLFSTSGILMIQTTADHNGVADVDISNLPNGAYIVCTDSSSFKIIKK